jgi:hypothetical protein
MKKLSYSFALLLAACGGGSGLGGDDQQPLPDADVVLPIDTPPGVTAVMVPAGDITTDTHWTTDHVYVLEGHVFVTAGTLTIDAGVTVQGKNGSSLTITKNAKLNATGTAVSPIVFTSALTPQQSGDWGGLVMLGKAPINVTGGTNNVEGFATSYGDRIAYGGTDAAHDCGTLQYARIEYAGFQLAVDNELNGVTVGGCGSATTIDYVQVHLGLDDGVEIFGGTVDVKHIVVTQPDDDGLDWDLGWAGRAQFVVVQQKLGRGDKGIEADNNRNDNELTPRSAPEIWNLTLIGADGAVSDPQAGIHMRRGTAGKINNAIVAYFTKFGVDIDGSSSVNQYNASNLTFANTYFVKGMNASAIWPANFDANSSNVQNDCPSGGGACFDEAAAIGGVTTNKLDIDVQLTAPKNITAPSWKPATGSPVLSGCGTPPAGFDQSATFCGAIGAADWTTGWTRFPG